MTEIEQIQHCFKIIYKHALIQQTQSGFKTDFPFKVTGRYRHNGLKCFIGILINDNAYKPWLENKAVSDTNVINALEDSGINISIKLIDFLSRLQYIHDSIAPHFWASCLKHVALSYNLNIEKI